MQERQASVGQLDVNYKIAGEGPALFILPGWLSFSEKWKEIQEGLAQQGYSVVVPDLPGFGESSAPQSVWGVEEYAEFLWEFANKLGIEKFFLAGHSFGGQVAIQFAALYPEKLHGLILLAAAGVRRNLGPKERVLRFFAKPLNAALSLIPSEQLQDAIRGVLYRLVGKGDYAKTKGIMKKVMAKVIRQDLTMLFPRIIPRTLIIWGDQDKTTPLEDGLLMKEHIPDSSLKILPGIGHRIRHEAPEKLSETILTFLKTP